MKKYVKIIETIIAFAIFISATIIYLINRPISEETKKTEFAATPIVIENKDMKEAEKFKKAVSHEVQEILNGDIILTVYSNETEDFCYYGKAELINDGSDGTEVILIIHEDKKVSLDDVF